MNVFRLVAVVNVMLLASLVPALAQEAQPCTRGSSLSKMGGIDLDVLRCQMAVVEQQRNNALDAAAGNQASVMIQQGDLAAAQNREAATKAWLDVAWPAYAKSIAAPAPAKSE